MSKAIEIVIGVAFFLLILLGLGGLWWQGVKGLVRARHTGEISSGVAVGRRIYRSSDAKAFNRACRWRAVYVTLLILPVAWFAFLALSLLTGTLLS